MEILLKEFLILGAACVAYLVVLVTYNYVCADRKSKKQ